MFLFSQNYFLQFLQDILMFIIIGQFLKNSSIY